MHSAANESQVNDGLYDDNIHLHIGSKNWWKTDIPAKNFNLMA